MGHSRSLLERMIASADGRDRDAFVEFVASDCEFAVLGMTIRGREQMAEFGRAWDQAFSGGRHTIGSVVEAAAGDRVTAELQWTGTHTGTLATPQGEVPATGRQITLDHAIALRAEDGMVASMHVYFDQLDFMAQLGLVPQVATA